ncbi:MAG: RNA polymerase subunit sigma-24 [Armatimonadota bacterium]
MFVYGLTDSELIERACEGEERAFEALFQRYHASVYHLLLGMLNNHDDAQELAQEVFLRVYQELPRLQVRHSLGAWLRRTATNLAIDKLRRNKRVRFESLEAPMRTDDEEVEWQIEDPNSDVMAAVESRELSEAVQNALSQLGEMHRAVVILHYIEGVPLEEIAETLGIPVGTVKSRLARARLALRELLKDFLDVEGENE